MTLTKERLGFLLVINIVLCEALLLFVISRMFNVFNSELVPIAFLPAIVVSGAGTYKIITGKDRSDGVVLLGIGLGIVSILYCFLIILPALQAESIYVYSQNISLVKYFAPLSNKIVVVKLKVSNIPKSYYILIYNSRDKFVKVRVWWWFVSCNVLSWKLVHIVVGPAEQWIAPRETKTFKLTVYSKVNYTDICTITLAFKVS